MAGIGSSARLKENEDGYYCSRCRGGIDPRATACPHCGRNIKPSRPPFWKYLMGLGTLLMLIGVGLFAGAWVFITGEQAVYVTSRLGLIGISLGGIVLMLAKMWTWVYPIMTWVVYYGRKFSGSLVKPLVAVPKWIVSKIR